MKNEIILAKVVDNIYEDEKRQVLPQQMRIRKSTSTFIALSLADEKNIKTPQAIVFENDLSVTKIKRIGVSSFAINWITPNCNKRNNTIGFRVSADGGITFTDYKATVVEGFYTSPLLMLEAIVLQMSAVSGLTFTGALDMSAGASNRNGFINLLGGSEYVFLDSSIFEMSSLNPQVSTVIQTVEDIKMDDMGESLVNLPKLSPFIIGVGPTFFKSIDPTDYTASKLIGSIGLLYTRYVDVQSKIITQYASSISSSNSTFNFGLIFRLYIGGNDFKIMPSKFISDNTIPIRYLNYNPLAELRKIDITILDDKGKILYLPKVSKNTNSGFDFSLFFEVQN